MARLQRVELVQLGAALLFGVTLFLPWYSTDDEIAAANIDGHTGDVTAWTAHPLLRWFLVAAVVAALWSAWQTMSGQQPTQGFHRGETSAVVTATVVLLVLVQGWINRPGEPSVGIDLAIGWYVALLASLVAAGAAVARLPQRTRKPPGV